MLAKVLEDHVVILIDGSPFALVVPAKFYYQRWTIATFIRWVRYVTLIISLFLPSAYVSRISLNQEMSPTDPLREAGLRMPRSIGQAVSIVGVLVLSDAAVRAGVISPIMIVVVGMTALASLAIPDYGLGNAVRALWHDGSPASSVSSA